MPLFFKNKAKEFDKLLTKAQKQNSEKRYKEALESLFKAEDLLAGEEAQAHQWAWIYDARRYAQYELGQVDEALNTCRKAIEHLSNTQLFAYLSEDSHVRGTLRSAHNMLAWTLCERAAGEAECQVALEHINKCMATTSPIDDEYQLRPFYETQAIVLLRMSELAKDPTSYKTQLFTVLTKMKKKSHEALTENAKLAEICRSPEFEAHFADDPEAKLKVAPPGETVDQALARYKAALDYYSQINPDYAEYYEIQEFKPLDEAKIAKHEAAAGIKLPPELREFALTKGVLTIGSYETKLAILEHWDEEKIAEPGLVNYIDYCWGGRPEFEEFYKPQQIEHVDKHFFAFGAQYIDDNCHEYLFFDSEGNFDSIFMDQDSFGYFQEDFNPLLKTTKIPNPQSFSALFSGQITDVIEKLQQQINDE